MEDNEMTAVYEEERPGQPKSPRHTPLVMLAFTALFAALTAVGAFIRIPTPWLAFTLQLLFVFLSGILLCKACPGIRPVVARVQNLRVEHRVAAL